MTGSLHVRVDALTSQTGRFRSLVGVFFETEFRRVGAQNGAYAVTIEIERTPDSPIRDLDAVAKVILETLTGVVFLDGSQVERLQVEKIAGQHARVKVRARPIPHAA